MFTAVRVAAPRKSRLPRGRRLVLVDIENVVGGAVASAASVHWAREQVAGLVGLEEHDHVVIGTCHRGLLTVGGSWTDVRYVVGSGPDGADLALLEVLEENIAERFADLVLVSGDGIFTDAVAALGGQGVKVLVVAHPDGLSRRLAMAATESALFDERWNAHRGIPGGAA
jgi:hypothetical protein